MIWALELVQITTSALYVVLCVVFGAVSLYWAVRFIPQRKSSFGVAEWARTTVLSIYIRCATRADLIGGQRYG